MSELVDCIFLGKGIKLIGDTFYVGTEEYPNVPVELQRILRVENPKITVDNERNLVIIDKWEYKDNKWQKTFKGLVNKIL